MDVFSKYCRSSHVRSPVPERIQERESWEKSKWFAVRPAVCECKVAGPQLWSAGDSPGF